MPLPPPTINVVLVVFGHISLFAQKYIKCKFVVKLKSFIVLELYMKQNNYNIRPPKNVLALQLEQSFV